MRSIQLAVVAVLTAGAAQAEPLAVFVRDAVDVTPKQAEAFGSVCAGWYGKALGREVIPMGKAQAALAESNDAVAAAKALGANEFVTLDLVHLVGEGHPARLIVTASRSSVTGAVLNHEEMTLASVADAPAACSRLAEAAARGVSTEETRTRHNVTAAEEQVSGTPTRLHATKLGGVKAGFGKPFGGGNDYAAQGTVGASLLLEREAYFLEVGAGILVPAKTDGSTGYGGVTGEIGGNYYLSEANSTMFVGGGIMTRIVSGGSILNLAPYVQLGFMTSRDSSTRLFGELRLAQNLLSVDDTGTLPTEVTVNIGLTF